MNYWVMHVYNKEVLDHCLKNNIWLMQEQYNKQNKSTVTKLWKDLPKIKIGDVLVLSFEGMAYAIGNTIKCPFTANNSDTIERTLNDKTHAFQNGIVSYKESDVFYENFNDLINNGGAQRISVKEWFPKNDKYAVSLEGIKNYVKEKFLQKTFYEIKEIFFNTIKKRIMEAYMNNPLNKMIEMLKANNQLILTGSPGTGKTFTAKKLACEIIGSKNEQTEEFERQVELIQFHPSYDYTDFIEGLRPVSTNNQQITFALKNGHFKDFCRKAGVIERILSNNITGITQLKGEIDNVCKGLPQDITKFWKDWIENNNEKVEGILNSKNEEKNKATSPENPYNALPKFIFIIDEINRAELSKVFGEIMFSLEPEYRGIKGKVKTQYANLSTDETFFIDQKNDSFFIPSNVYIIGTMNDIDRSIEIFDFALRRRFAWYEIKAEACMEAVLNGMLGSSFTYNGKNNIEDIAKLMTRAEELNKKINKQEGLNENYNIGPAYFAKIKHYVNDPNPLELLWTYHIEPLLREYVKGIADVNNFIIDCHKAFE